MPLLREAARHFAEESSARRVHQRTLGGTPAVGQVQVTIDPPRKSAAWREAATLELDVVHWEHAPDAAVAFVSALGKEGIAPNAVALRRGVAGEDHHARQPT